MRNLHFICSGAWFSNLRDARRVYGYWDTPSISSFILGFRLVRNT